MTALLTADQTIAATTDVHRVAEAVTASMSSLLAGRHAQIEVVTACVLARGHVLIEDVPGVGKTLLAQALAASIGGSFSRIQGTADLLPSDIVGSLTPSADGLGLHFRPGPILANVVLFDELNRVNVIHAEEAPVSTPLEPPAYDRVVDIEVPALVTVGEYDISEVLAAYEYLLSALPNASGCVFRDTAHLPSVERPAEVERVLLGWLGDNNL